MPKALLILNPWRMIFSGKIIYPAGKNDVLLRNPKVRYQVYKSPSMALNQGSRLQFILSFHISLKSTLPLASLLSLGFQNSLSP